MGRKKSDEVGEHAEFAARLKLAVEKAGLTGNQNKIGDQFDMTGAFYGQLLKGTKLPSTDKAISIAVRLWISIEWLMTGRGEMEFLGWSDPVEKEIFRLLKALPSEYREEILRLIRASAKLQEPQAET